MLEAKIRKCSARGLTTAASFVLGACLPLASRATASGKATDTPTARIRLADWNIEQLSQIGFVEAGLRRQSGTSSLSIYAVRRERPRVVRTKKVQRKRLKLRNGAFLVSHFSTGNTNRLGGYFGHFFRAPSVAEVFLAAEPGNNKRRCLAFRFSRSKSGFCGFWVHFFDFKKRPDDRQFVDARGIPFLTFEVRGALGGESITLSVIDRRWFEREDSVPIGEVSDFVRDNKITRSWQKVWFPLWKLPKQVDRSHLAGLAFVVAKPLKSSLWVRDLAFAEHSNIRVTHSPLHVEGKRPLRRALWLWRTEGLLKTPHQWPKFVNWCHHQQITDVFLQLPYHAVKKHGRRMIRWPKKAIGKLIRRLHSRSIRVEALDGQPSYALATHHDHVVSVLRSIVDYNARSKPVERFDGVRYDNEAYLLPGFSSVRRRSILVGYLRLLRKARQIAHAAKLTLGADIPFWFDSHSYGEPVASLRGRPFSEWVIDAVDSVALMDYRTQAYGPDGIIAHARDELAYAARHGKPVFIGLEFTKLPDEQLAAFSRNSTGGAAALILLPGEPGFVSVRWIQQPHPSIRNTETADPRKVVLFSEKSNRITADKITFARKTKRDFQRVVKQLEHELAPIPSFRGFALHSYEAYRPWIGPKRSR